MTAAEKDNKLPKTFELGLDLDVVKTQERLTKDNKSVTFKQSEQTTVDSKSRDTTTVTSQVSTYNGKGTVSGTVSPSVVRTDTERWAKLQNLQLLYDQGFISATEYAQRKSQLIDALTGTSTSTSTSTSTDTRTRTIGSAKPPRARRPEPTIARGPPDFTNLPEERAIKHIFDPESRVWSKKPIRVKIEPKPFAKGGLRRAFHLKDLSFEPTTVYQSQIPELSSTVRASSASYVAKIAIDPNEDRETYFKDAEMQMYAKQWADRYNKYDPPKRVDFILAYVLELIDREGSPLCCVERFVAGPYRKHNNNFGYVSEDERSTPQAFSHFTYEASGHQTLICDIQGVADLYTDPQMHTSDRSLGKGNLGVRGFEKFLQTHRCNAICRYLRLPSINAKPDEGTLPATSYMHYKQVDVVQVHYGASEPNPNLLPSFKPSSEAKPLISSAPPPPPKKSRECLCVIL